MRGRFTAALALALFAFTTTHIPGTNFSSAAQAAEADSSKSAVVGARTEVNIARIKNALRLTPEQLEAWATIENTLITIAREQAQQIADAAQPASRRVVAIVFNNTNVQRLASAAMPLIKTLKPEQKKVAQDMAQQIGLGAYASFI